MGLREEYHLTIMDDSGLVARLRHELKDFSHEYELTWPEFKRDPFGFTKRTFVGYGQMLKKFLRNRMCCSQLERQFSRCLRWSASCC